MLRSYFTQTSRTVASSSKCGFSASLHTSTALCVDEQRQRIARETRKANIQKRAERARNTQANRAHVILGTRPGEEGRWERCDLAQAILTEEQLRDLPPPVEVEHPLGVIHMPQALQYGIGEEDKRLLFQDMLVLSAEAALGRENAKREEGDKKDKQKLHYNQKQNIELHSALLVQEFRKTNQLAKLVDLRNTNAAGLLAVNKKKIIEAFSTPENPNDPGRPEVQAAIMTMRIRNLWSHLTSFKRDVGNRRALRKLVHKRAKILRYLRRLDLDRYEALLPRLALEPEAVEGELVV